MYDPLALDRTRIEQDNLRRRTAHRTVTEPGPEPTREGRRRRHTARRRLFAATSAS